jgi:membrane protease subunit HflK
MRRTGPASELSRLTSPIAVAADAVWRRMHWWIAAMALLYAVSGITIVRSDEVALVLRWGRLVGETPALQEQGPGLLFAFPRPIDRVVRAPVKHVFEVAVSTLAAGIGEEPDEAASTLNPVSQGYALTGDHNIVHVEAVARYRIRDAADWAFYGPRPESVLRVEVTSALVRSLGEMDVDRVLADGRKLLVAAASRRTQDGLDAAHSGLELTSLELTRLAPPAALASAFDAVQSAFIRAETQRKEAQTFAERTLPEAQASVTAGTQTAQAVADAQLATARGDAQAFRALADEYRANRAVVRERLYRDAIERSLEGATIRWIPPPVNGTYRGLRLSLNPGTATVLSDEDERQ